MSAGVSEQRMKGQGNQANNGPKEQLGGGAGGEGGIAPGSVSEDFESWRSQQAAQAQQQQQAASGATHTPYAASVPISSATDPYNMSTAAGYYGSGGTFPYQAFGVGDGTWSNGTDPMTFLGGYPHDSYSMDGMFGPSTTFSTTAFGQPSAFNYFPGNGDYSTWGTTQLGQRKPHYDDYYRTDTQNMYAMQQDIKSVEQNMQSLSIDMSGTNNLHTGAQLGHSLGPQLAKGDGKDMKSDAKDISGFNYSQVVQPKKMTWASIASQPAKPQVTLQSGGLKKKGPGMPPGPIVPGKHNMDIGTWDTSKAAPPPPPPQVVSAPPPMPPKVQVNVNVRPAWPGPVQPTQPPRPGTQGQPPVAARTPQQQQQVQQQQMQQQAMQQQTQQQVIQQQVHQQQQHYIQQHPVSMPHIPPPTQQVPPQMPPPQLMMSAQQQQHQQQQQATQPSHPVLDELRVKNNYNPEKFDLSAPGARFFVIKSYSEDDIHRSIKYEIWCSTEHGNKRLDQAFREREKQPDGCVYLFFSVNGSGHFCGMAQMMSAVDYHSNSSVWSQDKWRGQFRVRWIYVKDVPNLQLRHIRLENNENKPVTNSRDTQEVPHARGLQVLRILHSYKHSTSIFDDFVHYEKRQEEEDSRKVPENPVSVQGRDGHGGGGGHHHHRGGDHHGGRGGDRGGASGDGGERGHGRDRRNQDRNEGGHQDSNHRSGGQRNNHDGPHHKDRGDNNSRGGSRGGRGSGRNMN